MSSKPYTDEEYAMMLAGVFQAARQAFELAHDGHTDDTLLEASIQTLFQHHPQRVIDVYGRIEYLRKGLETFIDQVFNPQKRNAEITQYSIRLLQLGYKIYKDSHKTQNLARDLENYESRIRAFGLESAIRYNQLAKIYQDHISIVHPRILVKGNPTHLQNNDIAARIRVALLCGIRSAFLWYQCGGRRWHLITRQKRLLEAAHKLLSQTHDTP